ncbi:MAG: ABC transporter ATP-binding protein/permease, partial [Gammaproteobacteria bacterium]
MDNALNKFYNDEQILSQRHYNIWQLIKIYWQSKQKYKAWLFIVVIFIMTIAIVTVDLIFNYWYNDFYSSLQAYNVHRTMVLMGYFCLIAIAAIVLTVYRYYITQLFALRWRRWLTEQFLGYWLHKRGYYYLENFDRQTDNPDQRIQEDVGALVSNSLDLATNLISSITTFFAFIFVLWQLSGDLHLHIFSWKFHIPGYLMWVSLLYCAIGSLLTYKIGRPLVMLNFEQQRREATFRFAAIDLRSHSENVALSRGEFHQRRILDRLLSSLLENWYFIILRQKMLIWFTS